MTPSTCCSAAVERSPRWDRFYCTGCHAWLSPMCTCAERGVPHTLEGCQFQGDCPVDARGEQRAQLLDVIADPTSTVAEWLKAMDPQRMGERWREYPEYPHYQASNLGRIRNPQTKRILEPRWRGGYLAVQLHVRNADHSRRRIWRRVHTMVCLAWKGERPTSAHEACHQNGRRADCDASNLYWGTRTDQIEDKRKHGTLPKSVPPKSHASEFEQEIHCLWENGFSRTRIGAMLGCHRSTIVKIMSRHLKSKSPRLYDFSTETP